MSEYHDIATMMIDLGLSLVEGAGEHPDGLGPRARAMVHERATLGSSPAKLTKRLDTCDEAQQARIATT